MTVIYPENPDPDYEGLRLRPDLPMFLNARYDELESDARESFYEGQRWIPEEEAVVLAADLDPIMLLDRKCDAAHAANWSPEFVLADIAAKRRIVEQVALMAGTTTGRALDWAARVLALPFADHPDYREEWRL